MCDAGGRVVCGSSLAGTVGSNSSNEVNVCLLWVLYVVQVEASASAWSLVQGRRTECLCVQWVLLDVTFNIHDEEIQGVELNRLCMINFI